MRSVWQSQEDSKLAELVAAYGNTKWTQVCQMLPGRTAKQCRERWKNHLSPGVKKGPWSREEDLIIVMMMTRVGLSWTRIARVLDGRTDAAIANRFHQSLKERFSIRSTKSDDGSMVVSMTLSTHTKAIIHKLGQVKPQDMLRFLTAAVADGNPEMTHAGKANITERGQKVRFNVSPDTMDDSEPSASDDDMTLDSDNEHSSETETASPYSLPSSTRSRRRSGRVVTTPASEIESPPTSDQEPITVKERTAVFIRAPKAIKAACVISEVAASSSKPIVRSRQTQQSRSECLAMDEASSRLKTLLAAIEALPPPDTSQSSKFASSVTSVTESRERSTAASPPAPSQRPLIFSS